MIKNFKGNIYTLTQEDRIKGGKVSSKRKTLANGLKNLKHGKYSSDHILLLSCIDCPFISKCEKKQDGFCSFLLDELKIDKKFFRIVKELKIENGSVNLLDLVRKKYQMNRQYIDFIEEFDSLEGSDSNG